MSLAVYYSRARSNDLLGRSNLPSLRVLRTAMSGLEISVAKVTHQSHLSVFHELWRLVALAQKELFAGLAPSLKVAGIAAVLNKAHNFFLGIEHMTANDCRRTLAV
jgi:hypothetical protein